MIKKAKIAASRLAVISAVIVASVSASNSVCAPSATASEFMLPQNYENASATRKRDYLWQKGVLPTLYAWDELPLWSLGKDLLASLALLDFSVTLNRQSDVLPAGRKKIFHPLGSVGLAHFEAAPNTPWTGLLRGAIGMVRFSLATDPTHIGFMPGISIKWFVDGAPSINVFALHGFDPQESRNFFALDLSNSLPEPKNALFKAAAALLRKLAHANPFVVSVAPMAGLNGDGSEVAHPVAPEVLDFRPTSSAQSAAAPRGGDFREDLGQMSAGLVLYEVYADGTLAGHLVLDSQILPSVFGDESLFFKHEAVKP